jgi:hypothetical protein
MYRPKIELDDATGGKKFYRPRIYLTVPKDITLTDSNKTRKIIRLKAAKAVTYDTSSRRYVHTPTGPMSEADRIAFYLDPKFRSPMKELSPVKRLQKAAGPRGKDLSKKVVEDYYGAIRTPTTSAPTGATTGTEYVGITQTTPRDRILQSLQYMYISVRLGADNKSLSKRDVERVANSTYQEVYASYYSEGVEAGLRSMLVGCSDVRTLMFDLSKKDVNSIAAAVNSVPDITIVVGNETSRLKEFVVGMAVTTSKSASFQTVRDNIDKIITIIYDKVSEDIKFLSELTSR